MENLPLRIQGLVDIINQAISQIENGDLIDLTSLDNEVAAICEAAANTDPARMEEIDDKMDMMITRLEDLSKALAEFEHGENDQ